MFVYTQTIGHRDYFINQADGTGRTNILFGLVHMLVFAVFLFMVFVP